MLALPIKHGEGCYVADETTLAELERERQVVFRYVERGGRADAGGLPERLAPHDRRHHERAAATSSA